MAREQLVFEAVWRDRGARKGMQDLGRQTEQTHREFQKSKSSIVGFGGAAKAALGGAAIAAVAWGGKIASGNEQARISFTTMLGSAEKADKLLRDLNKFAATTPFEFPEIADASKKLLAFGFTAQEIEPNLRSLGDLAAGLNIPLGELTEIYGKARVQGRLFMEDINQLTGRGIPVIQEFAKQFGVSESEVRGLVESGKIGFPQLQKAMQSMTSEGGQFAGMMEAQSKSLAGMWSTLKDTFGQGLAEAIAPSLPGLKSLFGFLGSNADVIIPLGAGVAGLTGAVWAGHKAWQAYAAIQSVVNAGLTSNNRAVSGLAGVVSKAGPWGLAIAGGATLLGLFAGQQARAEKDTRAFTDQLTFQKGALDANSRQMLVKKLADEGALEVARRAGIAEADYVRALLEGGPVRDAMIARLQDTGTAARRNVDALEGDITAQEDLANASFDAADKLELLGGGLDATRNAALLADSAMAGTTTATDELKTKTNQLKGAQSALNTELQKSIDKFTILRDGALSTERANLAWEESVDAVRTSVKENGRSLDSHTAKGRSNRNAVINMITALNDKVTADVKNAGAVRKGETAQERYERVQKTATGATRRGIEAIREHARRAGLNKDQVNAMIKEFVKSPAAAGRMGAGVDKARREIKDLDRQIDTISNKRVAINFSTNAYKIGKTKFAVNLTAPSSAGRSGPAHNHPGFDLNRVVGPPASAPSGGPGPNQGGAQIHGEVGNVPRAAKQFPGAANSFANRFGRGAAQVLGEGLARGLANTIESAGAPGGRVGIRNVGAGWGPIYAAMRRHGARTFNTYPGHHPSMAMARDVYPHNWAAANAARALSSVWYVIYRMRIASKNHGNTWRQYRPTNFRGDWRHVRHIHVARRYDQGGMWPSGSLGVNLSGRAERVLTSRQNQGFERITRAVAAGTAGNTYVVTINAPNYVGDKRALRDTIVDLAKNGHLDVVRKATR